MPHTTTKDLSSTQPVPWLANCHEIDAQLFIFTSYLSPICLQEKLPTKIFENMSFVNMLWFHPFIDERRKLKEHVIPPPPKKMLKKLLHPRLAAIMRAEMFNDMMKSFAASVSQL